MILKKWLSGVVIKGENIMINLSQKLTVFLSSCASGLILLAFSPIVLSVESAPSVKEFHYKVNFNYYYKQFRAIQGRRKRGQYFGVVMPVTGKTTTTLYQTTAFKVASAIVTAGSVCKVINHRELYIKNSAKVNCNQNVVGYLPLSKLAYDVSIKTSANKNVMLVTWRTVCGGDSCTTKNWLFYSLKLTNKRKRRQGWMRELKQRDDYFIHPAGKYFLYTLLSTSMANSPENPRIYFQEISSGNTRLLVKGLSPAFHPYGKLIFYRNKAGSVYSTTVKTEKSLLIYKSPYPEKEMYQTGAAISSGQAPVTFTRRDRISIGFKNLNSAQKLVLLQHKIDIKKLMKYFMSDPIPTWKTIQPGSAK